MSLKLHSTIKPWVYWFIPVLFYIIMYAMQVLPAINIVEMKSTLNINDYQIGQLKSAFLYTYVLMQIPVGLLFDRYKSKKLLTVALVFFSIGNVICALTTNFHMALLARALMGFGGSFSFIGCLYLSRIWMPPSIFAAMVAITESLLGVSSAGFNTLFTLMKTHYTYQHIAFGTGIFSFCLAIVAYTCIAEKNNKKGRVDVFNYLKTSLPKILSNKIILLLAVFTGFAFVSYGVMTNLWAVEYLRKSFDLKQIHAVMINSLTSIGFIIGCPLVTYIANRYCILKTMIISSILITVTSTLSYIIEIPIYEQMSVLFLLGIFTSCSILPFIIAKHVTDEETYGLAAGLINMSFGGMSIIFIKISSHLLTTTKNFEMATIPVIAAGAGAFIIACVLLTFSIACKTKWLGYKQSEKRESHMGE